MLNGWSEEPVNDDTARAQAADDKTPMYDDTTSNWRNALTRAAYGPRTRFLREKRRTNRKTTARPEKTANIDRQLAQ